MRLMLALGAALAATAVMAHARAEDRQNERTHILIRHGGPGAMDADQDGWITRAESAAAADRIFDELDRNHDGRLDRSDRPEVDDINVHIAPPAGEDDNCERTESNENGQRRVTVICRTEHEARAGSDRTERREVIVRHHGGSEGAVVVAPVPPHPPMAPVGPMFVMMFGEESEADLNNDGAISREEFRAQHMRMFDAHDANGDGRIRAPRMPDPPAPPVPPTPPSPPRRG